MDEREFYTATNETKRATYTCPKCRQESEFQIRWLRRAKKKEIPPGTNDLGRAKSAKAIDYLVRVDDQVIHPSPRCRKRFDIPSEQTVALI